MKKNLISFLILLIVFFSACNNAEKNKPASAIHAQDEAVTYTCPMHPEVESNEPGICPKCKMNLELKVSDATDQIVSPATQVLSRQSTVKMNKQSEAQTIKSQGYIDIDRTRSKTIAARFGGRIEKLFVNYDLQFVKKGDKILELYSPEINTIQQEHLFLLKSGKEESLLKQSKEKLKQLGISEFQISELENKKSVTKTITIYSPADGYVFFNAETKTNSTDDASKESPMNKMSLSSSNNDGKNFSSSSSQIREGMYVNEGETLFSINDLQNVWAIVSVGSEFHSLINENSEVKIISELFPEKTLIGKISLTEKIFEDNNQRFIRVRIDLPNSNGELKINTLVTAEITLDANDSDRYQSQLPTSSVYRTGLNSFVWVKTGTTKNGTGIFQLRKVITGSVINGVTTILNGLSANEEVAEHAGYLSDSETFLNEK